MTAHWGVADPAAVEGDEVTRLTAFRTALRELENRIKIFVALPFASLDRLKLQQKLDEIGQLTSGGRSEQGVVTAQLTTRRPAEG